MPAPYPSSSSARSRQARRFVDAGRGEQRLDLGHREGVGEDAAAAGRLEPVARVGLDPALAEQKAVVGADGGDLAPDRGGA